MADCPVCLKVYPLNEIEFHVELCLTQSGNDDVMQPGNIRNSNPQLHANKWTDPNPYQLDTDDGLDQDYQQLLSSINNIYGRKEASKPNPQPPVVQLHAEEIAPQKIEPSPVIIPKAVLPDNLNATEDQESYYELELRGSFVQEIMDLVGDDLRATTAEQVANHLKNAWSCRVNNALWQVEGMSEVVADLVRRYVATRSDWREAMHRLSGVKLTNRNLGMFSVLPQELVFIVLNQSSAFTNCVLAQCSKDMKDIGESDIIWREQFARDFKSTKKLNEGQNWKQNYREAFGVEMNGVISIAGMRPIKWTYSHSTRAITKGVPGSIPQKFTLTKDNRIAGGSGQYFWSGNTLRSVGMNKGSVTFSPDAKSFQCFVNGVFSWFNTRVVKEFPAEWQISKLSGATFIRMTVTGYIPIPLLAFVCYATQLDN